METQGKLKIKRVKRTSIKIYENSFLVLFKFLFLGIYFLYLFPYLNPNSLLIIISVMILKPIPLISLSFPYYFLLFRLLLFVERKL
jgi:hypothetical protein